MPNPIASHWSADAGKSLVEYTLLLAFLAIVVLALSASFNKPAAGPSSTTISQLASTSAVLD